MKRHIVKTKYTYEKINQTDFSYSDRTSESANRIQGRYNYFVGTCVGKAIVSKDESKTLDIEGGIFKSASGIYIKSEGEAEGICRVTFLGEGRSHMSVSNLCDTKNGACYSTLKMDFVPDKMLIECSTDEKTDISVSTCNVLNPLGEWGGQAHFYTCEGGQIYDDGEKLRLRVNGGACIESPEFPDRSDTVYNMLMPRRNTLFFVLGNECGAESARLYFTTTEHPEYSEDACVDLDLLSDGAPHAYYFNLSVCEKCSGRLKSFKLCTEGKGELVIYRYSFEQEAPIWEKLATDICCTASKDAGCVTVSGRLIPDAELDEVRVYTTCMRDETDTTELKTLVGATRELDGGKFLIDFPLQGEIVSRLSSQLDLYGIRGGEEIHLADRFYIENYEDFASNPNTFELPDYTVSVLDFGAYGDAYHDDTEAIQAAIDHASSVGGGRVVLPGECGIYGRRYIVTNILLKSCVELHFEEGAILWQSQIRAEYPYLPTYGHDAYVPGVNWTHNMHVSNLPLIQVANAHHVKLTGKGKIRGMDIGSEEGVDMKMFYSTGCCDRIHVIMLGIFGGEYVEFKDFEIVRCNNYHSAFYHCEYVYCGNLKYHEVKCLSGDGFGLTAGTHDILFNRCFFQSNDDCIVLTAVYNDPRGTLWWTNTEDIHCAPYNVKVIHSYIDAHTGGGIAFITWGTSAPVAEASEIYGVEVYDNYFGGQKCIGGWFDNPYKGKVPFDNTETDDYSPVKEVKILGNRYTDFRTMGPVRCTSFITDCGLHSHNDFVNGDFTLGGLANWTARKNSKPDSVKTVNYCNKEKGCIDSFDCGEVSLCEGLYLEAGKYTFECELMSGGCQLFVEKMLDGESVAAKSFTQKYPTVTALEFELTQTCDVFVGVKSEGNSFDGFAIIDFCKIIKK